MYICSISKLVIFPIIWYNYTIFIGKIVKKSSRKIHFSRLKIISIICHIFTYPVTFTRSCLESEADRPWCRRWHGEQRRPKFLINLFINLFRLFCLFFSFANRVLFYSIFGFIISTSSHNKKHARMKAQCKSCFSSIDALLPEFHKFRTFRTRPLFIIGKN